jgi:hypothetical protein
MIAAGARGRAVEGATLVAVGSGVIETVESPDPHPATVNVATPITTAHFTTRDRTAIAGGGGAGARRDYGWPALDSTRNDIRESGRAQRRSDLC